MRFFSNLLLIISGYKKIGLRREELTLSTSPLYGFIGESVIPEGTIKLVVTLGEPPPMTTVVIDFLEVNYSSTFNEVLGRPLLRALKVVTSIHCRTIKFPTIAGTGEVQGRQRDSRECYNRSLKLAENEPELHHAIEVEKISRWPMETNIDPCLQEDESTVRPIEELTEIKVDPNEPSHVVKISKGLKEELAQ